MALFRSFSGGIRSGNPQIQTFRINLGTFTVSQTRDIAITFPFPFQDANYTLALLLHDVPQTANISALRQIEGTNTNTGFTVKVSAGSTGYSDGQLFLHVIAWHD